MGIAPTDERFKKDIEAPFISSTLSIKKKPSSYYFFYTIKF